MTMHDNEQLNARIAETLRNFRLQTLDPDTDAIYTQRTFAKAIGLSRTTVSNVESQRQLVSIDYLYRAAIVLNRSLDELLPKPSEVAGALDTTIITAQQVGQESDLKDRLETFIPTPN